MNERKASGDLDRLSKSDDVLGGMAPAPKSAADEDAIELWARRAGRGLAALATVGLIGWILYEVAGGAK